MGICEQSRNKEAGENNWNRLGRRTKVVQADWWKAGIGYGIDVGRQARSVETGELSGRV